jgi:tetratricopeptide (TPR) repeat protein
MDLLTPTFLVVISLFAVLFRRPFQDFPLDDDFAIYTYRSRFSSQGFQWKKDLQLIGIPMWKMLLFDQVYRSGGVKRIRHLQTAFHVASSLAIYGALWGFTQNIWAGLTGALLYSFYGTSPDLTSGSFNFEQFYIPLIFLGLAFLQAGPEWLILAGICFGIATIPKYTTALFTGVLTFLVWVDFGKLATAQFVLSSVSVIALTNFIEWKMGYWDQESRQQMKTRMATTLRLTRTKSMHFSVFSEIGQLFNQALPIWLGLIPLTTYCVQNQNILLTTFSFIVLSMIILQRAFSRYHYLPLFALLSFGCGLGVDILFALKLAPALVILAIFIILLACNLKNMSFYYLRPTEPETLIHYEKFDQYLYLPRLGKILKRLMRMRGESHERIFVWGTFSQLYHLTNAPASDNFLHHSIGPWDTPDLVGFYDSFVGGLLRHKPKYLIKSFTDLDVARLEEITGMKYKLLKVVLVRFPVYRLESIKSCPENLLTLNWQQKMRHLESLTHANWHAPGLDRSDEERGKSIIAIRECKKLIKLNKKDVEGYDYLGDMYSSMELTNQAEEAFEHILQVSPQRPITRLKICTQKVKLNKLVEASDLIDEEIKLFGYNSNIAFSEGLLLKQKKDYVRALKKFEEVRLEEPECHDSWKFSSECMQSLGDQDGLKKLYDDAQNIHNIKDRAWLHTLIVKDIAKLNSSLIPEHETLKLYLKKDPKNATLRYALGSALEIADDLSGAYESFECVTISDYPEIQANAWFRMALLSSTNQQTRLLKECLKQQPWHQGAKDLMKNNL